MSELHSRIIYTAGYRFPQLSAVSVLLPWCRHQMETFSALLTLCAGNSPVPGEFPAQRPVTRSFDVFFDLHLNKRLSKQSWGWWFETLSWSSWRHCNASRYDIHTMSSSKLRYCRWLCEALILTQVGNVNVQYIPRNMHTVLLCFALLWLCNRL